MVAVVALLGCSPATKQAAPAGDGKADRSFQPVTIEHALGKAVITKKPQRIVTVGRGSAEIVLAMGVSPVGIESYPWGSDDTGYLPWIYEKVKRDGLTLPEQFTGSDPNAKTELNPEAVARLKPDLILGPWSGMTQQEYDKLSQIAPTVAYKKQPWVTPWRQQIEVVAQALGEPNKAKQLIEQVKQDFAKAAPASYRDTTFSYVYFANAGKIGVFYENEQRAEFLRMLGLTIDPVIKDLRKFEVPGTDSAEISLENASMLAESDLVFTFYSSPKERAQVEADPALKQIPAFARGSVVALDDPALVTATSLINPLTVPWAAQRYIPVIDQAIATAKK